MNAGNAAASAASLKTASSEQNAQIKCICSTWQYPTGFAAYERRPSAIKYHGKTTPPFLTPVTSSFHIMSLVPT